MRPPGRTLRTRVMAAGRGRIAMTKVGCLSNSSNQSVRGGLFTSLMLETSTVAELRFASADYGNHQYSVVTSNASLVAFARLRSNWRREMFYSSEWSLMLWDGTCVWTRDCDIEFSDGLELLTSRYHWPDLERNMLFYSEAEVRGILLNRCDDEGAIGERQALFSLIEFAHESQVLWLSTLLNEVEIMVPKLQRDCREAGERMLARQQLLSERMKKLRIGAVSKKS